MDDGGRASVQRGLDEITAKYDFQTPPDRIWFQQKTCSSIADRRTITHHLLFIDQAVAEREFSIRRRSAPNPPLTMSFVDGHVQESTRAGWHGDDDAKQLSNSTF